MDRSQDLEAISEVSTSLKIAAVFATMNRVETAVGCVKALAAQTRPPDIVVVADNVSSDGTASVLESLAGLPYELIVHRMSENRGNAGGVEEAMELAFARGADAVWILDDDSWPLPGALAVMLVKAWDPRVVRHALQINPRTGRFTWPLQVMDSAGNWKLIDHSAALPAGEYISSRYMWTGALIPREVREAVGPVEGRLFIRGEDEEYPWRIEQAGFKQEAVTGALMEHPGPDNLIRLNLLGRRFFYEPNLPDWKLYYKVRNMVWLKRRQRGCAFAITTAMTYAIVAALADGPYRLPLVIEAVKDGWLDKLGRRDHA